MNTPEDTTIPSGAEVPVPAEAHWNLSRFSDDEEAWLKGRTNKNVELGSMEEAELLKAGLLQGGIPKDDVVITTFNDTIKLRVLDNSIDKLDALIAKEFPQVPDGQDIPIPSSIHWESTVFPENYEIDPLAGKPHKGIKVEDIEQAKLLRSQLMKEGVSDQHIMLDYAPDGAVELRVLEAALPKLDELIAQEETRQNAAATPVALPKPSEWLATRFAAEASPELRGKTNKRVVMGSLEDAQQLWLKLTQEGIDAGNIRMEYVDESRQQVKLRVVEPDDKKLDALLERDYPAPAKTASPLRAIIEGGTKPLAPQDLMKPLTPKPRKPGETATTPAMIIEALSTRFAPLGADSVRQMNDSTGSRITGYLVHFKDADTAKRMEGAFNAQDRAQVLAVRGTISTGAQPGFVPAASGGHAEKASDTASFLYVKAGGNLISQEAMGAHLENVHHHYNESFSLSAAQ